MSQSARGLADIHRLSPRDFELLVADIWQERQGWTTEITDEGADMGIDILGQPPGGGALTVVQAKRYGEGNNVSSRQIQQYASIPQQFNRVASVTVVTTSAFTQQAQTAARQLDVKCIDGDDLLRLIDRYNAADIVEWYCAGKPTEGV